MTSICPAVATEVPLATDRPLALGFTTVANHVSDASVLGDPQFQALQPANGLPMRVYGYWNIGDTGRNDATLQTFHAYRRAGYYTSLAIHVAGSAPYQANGPPPLVGYSPTEYAALVSQIVQQYGADLDEVEISNEGNVPSPTTSDGGSAFVIDDIVQGVIAARQAARAGSFVTRIGFNYAFGYHAPTDDVFFMRLKAAIVGAPDFLDDVDFMGLHTYPQFLSEAPLGVDFTGQGFTVTGTSGYGAIEIDALHTGRCYMDYLGLARRIPIAVTEVGNTADPDYIAAVLPQIHRYRGHYNIDSVYYFTYEMLLDAAGASTAGYQAVLNLQKAWSRGDDSAAP